jgi:Predicted metal-binding, possibly nucleic acid-binding protein
MRLNLSDIIEMPGGILPFECELSLADYEFPSVAEFISNACATGQVRNMAGAIMIEGEIAAELRCICDRCASEFLLSKRVPLSVPVAEELEDDENPDIYLTDGDYLELTEILETVFILEMDTKFLCGEDCRGLCHQCGKNLNEGDCACKTEVDPRLAALSQFLDIDDSE